MADKPVGTIFVELDLDASRYTKGQQQLIKDAQSASTTLEKNFQNLGIKSAGTFDLMRAKTINSFEAIVNSSKATANDIIRAEAAKARKLQEINDKQYGEQKNLIDSLKSNWLAYAASIYTAYGTIGQALEMSKTGSVLEKQAAAFSNLSDAAGTSSRQMIDSLKLSSQGLVAEADLMASAGKAMLMSIPADKITELMKIAAATSKMTGQSITEAFADITIGVARQSRMILDNLGIIVNVDSANAKYAKTLGTTADALNDAQKRQAFMNAVLAAGADMISRLGSSSGELKGVNKLVAEQTNLWNEVNKTVATFLDKELSGYAKMLAAINNTLKEMRSGSIEATKSSAWKEIEMLKSLEAKGMAKPGTAAEKEAEFNAKYLEPQYKLKPSEEKKISGSFTTPAWNMSSWKEREGQFPENTAEQNKKIMEDFYKAQEDAIKKVEKAREDAMKKAEQEARQLDDEIKKYQEEFNSAKLFSGERSTYEMMEAQMRSSGELTQMEAERLKTESEAWAKEANSWNQNMMEKVAEYEKAHKKITDLSEETARAMQSNFSNLFFDAMTGKLKSLEDYARAVFDSMARMIADLMSQQLTRGLFGPDMKGGGWLSGLFGTSAANLPINTPGYFSSVQPFHTGGMVGLEGGPTRRIPSWMVATAPRYHTGVGPGERAAVLTDDEVVFTPAQMRALGQKVNRAGDTYHVYQISAIDTQSFAEAARRSGAIPALAAESYANNGILRSVLRGTP